MIRTQTFLVVETRFDDVLTVRIELAESTASQNDPDLEQKVDDFITRQVLERDSVLFEG